MLFGAPALFAIGLIGALLTFPWRDPRDRRRLPLLLLLLIPPAAAFFWGLHFRVPAGSNPNLPFWVTGFLFVTVAASIALPFVIVDQLPNTDPCTSWLSLSMVALTLTISFLADMEVTGLWI